jgi:hypothetical protein
MTDNGMPPPPMTALALGAAQFHEQFRAYVDAGFTEEQALHIVLTILTEMMHHQGRPGGQS